MKLPKRFLSVLISITLLAALFAGCSISFTADTPEYGDGEIRSSSSASGCMDKAEYAAPAEAGTALGMDAASGDYAYSEPRGVIIEPIGPVPSVQPQAGMLTAGAWNDNENYAFFKDVLNNNEWYPMLELWNLYPTSRIAVSLKSSDSQSPIKNAKVELFDSQQLLAAAVTDAEGKAYLYYNLAGGKAAPEKIVATAGNESAEYLLTGSEGDDFVNLTLDYTPEPSDKTLDLMFMVDTTGSMGDELEFLKEELLDVINRVSGANSGMKIRLSVNFYRDEGDEYVVRYFAFTEDIQAAIANLKEQYSAGGGDTPEAVDTALDNAINGHGWSDDSVKLLFFVLDAPPHSDRQGSAESIFGSISKAAELGVRIIPVASSGVDTETEFIMRTAAAVTSGTYTFLTDDSGIGNPHLEPTIGEYQVEMLNELMVRLINEYCA